MNIVEVREFCLSLPHFTEDIPFGKQGYDDYVAFREAGKIFAFLCVRLSDILIQKLIDHSFAEMVKKME